MGERSPIIGLKIQQATNFIERMHSMAGQETRIIEEGIKETLNKV